jgi:membrane-associated protein
MLGDQLLAGLVIYGLPVLFFVIVFAAIGLPLPGSLLLIAAGSFVEQGALNVWQVMGLAMVAAIMGDNIGYGIGRWGGRRVLARVVGWIGGEERLQKIGPASARWGGPGIFFTRWLIPPLGPAVNLTSGIAGFPWPSFLLFEASGAVLWVVLYTSLGRMFSGRVHAMNSLLGNIGWALIGILVAIYFGWRLVHFIRYHPPEQSEHAESPGRDDEPRDLPPTFTNTHTKTARRRC